MLNWDRQTDKERHANTADADTSALTNIVGERPFEAVEHEPAFLPRLDLASHLHQVALAHLLGEDDVIARLHAVTRRLDVRAQIKLLLPDGQVASHRTGLRGQTRAEESLIRTMQTQNLLQLQV